MSALTRLRRGALALHRDEQGAAMLFAAFTFLALSFSLMFVFQVGMISTDRIQMQNAADAAAYSGALMEANSLNAIGQLNDGMAYLHYTLLRYVVDCITVRTLEPYLRHDQWTKTQPGRFFQVGQGDGSIVLSLSDPNGLKPGDSYGPGALNPPAPKWVLLGDEGEWDARWQHIQRFKQLQTDGKKWLHDLQNAQRLIVAVTPRLVRETAVAVARDSGASHVAVSADLERAFQVGADLAQGWEEMKGTASSGGGGGPALTQNMWARYTENTLEVDGTARPFPTWFDTKLGKSQASPGYYQIRLCWNKNDWGHSSRPDSHTPPMPAPGVAWNDAPNGHWHCRHAHVIKDPINQVPVVVSHGGISMGVEVPCGTAGQGGGHFADDTPLHQQAQQSGDSAAGVQHAQVPCPTCGGLFPAGPGSRWSDVKKTHVEASPQDGMDLGVDDGFARPVMPRGALLRSGVTVAAWRDSHGVGEVFAASRWGMLALATAQVGLMDDAGRVLLLRKLEDKTATYGGVDAASQRTIPVADAADPRSFFHSLNPNRGMRFGARLVPIAGGVGGLHPWHPDLVDGGLDAMIGPDPKRWVKVDGGTNEVPPTVKELSGFLRIRTGDEMRRALWH